MKIAQDPTPFHHDHRLRDFPRVVADLGYEHIQLTPHRDFIPFFRHPKADACKQCSLHDICGGLFELGDWYDLAELAPVFVPKEPIIQRILPSGDA